MFHLKSFFLPHKHNNYHPYSTRIPSLFVYLIMAIFLNYILVPFFGLSQIHAQSATISTSKLVDLLNYTRTSSGLNGLSVDERLTNAAVAKANDMFSKQYWSHYGPTSESPWQFIKGSGYNYVYAGENLAKGFKDAQSTHDAWLNSPTHRANLLKKEYTNVGIAAVSGTLNGEELIIVVQMFGSPIKSTGPGIPQILTPLDGSRIYDKDINLKGIALNNSSVDIFDNGVKKGTLLTNGGVFDYKIEDQKDGIHNYLATQKPSNSSNPIGLTFDTYPNTIDTMYLFFNKTTDGVQIRGKFSENIKSILSHVGSQDIPLNNMLTSGIDQISSSQLKNVSEILLTLNDGTKDKGTFNVVIERNKSPIVPLSTTESAIAITQPFLTLSGKQQINLILSLFVGIVFGIDAYIIWKLKIKRSAGKSLFHFQNIFILIMLILVGTGIGGSL